MTSSWGPWNAEPAPNRSANGSTSPTRTRDSLHPSNAFYENLNTAIGQGRSYINGRRKSYLEEEKENNSGFGQPFKSFDADRAYQHEKSGSQVQEPGFLNLGAVGSRDSSIPPSRHSEDSHHSPPAFRDTLGYGVGHNPSNSIASTRPSVPNNSSYPTQSSNGRASYLSNNRLDEGDLAGQFKKSMALDDGFSEVSGGQQAFHLNPGSQPWHANLNGGSFNQPNGAEQYVTDLQMSQYINSKRPSPAPYRPTPSPKTFAPQPQEIWTQRPPSRDPRIMSDAERRPQAPAFMQAHAQPFYPGPYYNPSFGNNFPPNLYETFNRTHMLPGYGLPYGLPGPIPLRPSKEQDPGKGVRSVLLEEFRSSSKANNKRFELKDIYSHVVEFSGDQHGSRFIQQKLETANSDEKDQVFREIEPNALQLMKDVFGNYVIQKFFEHGNQVQKKVLAAQMKGKVVDLSMQMYACRVVQKVCTFCHVSPPNHDDRNTDTLQALEHVLVEQQAELVHELQPEIVKIIKDQNGNHVVQKVIELVPRQHIGFIMDCFRGQVSQLAAHTYGCRVVQRLLEHGTEEDKQTILVELHKSAQMLITDQYGNYVTQHVIEHGKPEDREKMIQLVLSQLVTLSKHKFASNVVEKCIQFGNADERRSIREQLSAPGPDGASHLQLIMKDQYGNYVIQKLLHELEGADREAFIEDMKPHFIALKKTTTGRQIAAIDRLISAASKASVSSQPQSTTPGQNTPALQLDVNSPAPTPVLTMDQNSPQSISPPSTHASAVGEAFEEGKKSQPMQPGGVNVNVQGEEAS